MYARGNPKTKTELKRRIAEGEKITIFSPGPFTPPECSPTFTGWCSIEGPHYPEPHRWYARARIESGFIIDIK